MRAIFHIMFAAKWKSFRFAEPQSRASFFNKNCFCVCARASATRLCVIKCCVWYVCTINYALCFLGGVPGLFLTDGQKVPGTQCDYDFTSSNFSLSKGKFFSPRFPSSYPAGVSCNYRFSARWVNMLRRFIILHPRTLSRSLSLCSHAKPKCAPILVRIIPGAGAGNSGWEIW